MNKNNMKYIITESQSAFIKRRLNESEDKPMKKFNRDFSSDKGEYGESIEKIALQYFKNPNDVCDIICLKSSDNEHLGEYILLVLMPYSINGERLEKYIKNFIPVNITVLITTSNTCKD